MNYVVCDEQYSMCDELCLRNFSRESVFSNYAVSYTGSTRTILTRKTVFRRTINALCGRVFTGSARVALTNSSGWGVLTSFVPPFLDGKKIY